MKRKNPTEKSIALPRKPIYLLLNFLLSRLEMCHIDSECVHEDAIVIILSLFYI